MDSIEASWAVPSVEEELELEEAWVRIMNQLKMWRYKWREPEEGTIFETSAQAVPWLEW
jgi:hypothetical protein